MYKLAIKAAVPNQQDAQYNWDFVLKAVSWPIVPRKGDFLDLDLPDFPMEYEVQKVSHHFPLCEGRPLIVVWVHIERELYELLRKDDEWLSSFTDEFDCI